MLAGPSNNHEFNIFFKEFDKLAGRNRTLRICVNDTWAGVDRYGGYGIGHIVIGYTVNGRL